jgi:drug/metabolite transporter (DMT)-like permease
MKLDFQQFINGLLFGLGGGMGYGLYTLLMSKFH